jgi:hypothetical protein
MKKLDAKVLAFGSFYETHKGDMLKYNIGLAKRKQ